MHAHEPLARSIPSLELARLAVVRGPPHLLQRTLAASAARDLRVVRRPRDASRRRAGARMVACPADDRRRLLLADRLEQLLRARKTTSALRSATCRGWLDRLGMSRRVADHRRWAMAGARTARIRLVPRPQRAAAVP